MHSANLNPFWDQWAKFKLEAVYGFHILLQKNERKLATARRKPCQKFATAECGYPSQLLAPVFP